MRVAAVTAPGGHEQALRMRAALRLRLRATAASAGVFRRVLVLRLAL